MRPSRPAAGPARLRHAALLAACSALLAACGGQGAFRQEAQRTASELAAAATTLEYVHTGRLPASFGRSSFVAYRDSLRNAGESLSGAQGAPTGERMDRLMRLYARAWAAVQEPCLDAGCGWSEQVRAMKDASAALDEAAGP